MKSIILKVLVYVGFIALIHLLAAYRAGGKFDPFYLRFTNGTHQSMILGTSRAAQGLRPDVLNQKLGDRFADINNFAFTLLHSPFGEVYLQAIQTKLDTQKPAAPRLFLIAVDPWSVCATFADGEETIADDRSMLATVSSVDHRGRPNFEYLTEAYPDSWGKILFDPLDQGKIRLHEDGWLEVTVPMDEASVQKRTAGKLREYRNGTLPKVRFSAERYQYLQQTVDLLKPLGTVVLLRLPVIAELLELEQELMPDFEQKICALSLDCQIPYWSFARQPAAYQYTDGNHLYKASASLLSGEIADRLLAGPPFTCDCQ